VTVAEAAKQLGVTQEAVRGRIRRGTIEYEKDSDGKTYVYLTPEETEDNYVDNPMVNGYINALKSQIGALERDKEQMREESTRKDHIIMALTQRIPAIEAPVEQSTEQRESTLSASETEAKGDVPHDAAKREMRKSWWQRWFGT
jgi:excisionase family DNA binding protein